MYTGTGRKKFIRREGFLARGLTHGAGGRLDNMCPVHSYRAGTLKDHLPQFWIPGDGAEVVGLQRRLVTVERGSVIV